VNEIKFEMTFRPQKGKNENIIVILIVEQFLVSILDSFSSDLRVLINDVCTMKLNGQEKYRTLNMY
jgi:hypothetical protein